MPLAPRQVNVIETLEKIVDVPVVKQIEVPQAGPKGHEAKALKSSGADHREDCRDPTGADGGEGGGDPSGWSDDPGNHQGGGHPSGAQTRGPVFHGFTMFYYVLLMFYYVLAFKRLKKECWRGAPGPSGSAGRGPKAFGATWNLLSTPLECSRLQI